MSGATTDDVLRTVAYVYAADWSGSVRDVLFAPKRFRTGHSVEAGRSAVIRALPGPLGQALLPLAVVDEVSLACTVLTSLSDGSRELTPGAVVRLHLDKVDQRH